MNIDYVAMNPIYVDELFPQIARGNQHTLRKTNSSGSYLDKQKLFAEVVLV